MYLVPGTIYLVPDTRYLDTKYISSMKCTFHRMIYRCISNSRTRGCVLSNVAPLEPGSGRGGVNVSADHRLAPKGCTCSKRARVSRYLVAVTWCKLYQVTKCWKGSDRGHRWLLSAEDNFRGHGTAQENILLICFHRLTRSL